jgi:hypothetical protein
VLLTYYYYYAGRNNLYHNKYATPDAKISEENNQLYLQFSTLQKISATRKILMMEAAKPLKRRETSTSVHGATTQVTAIFSSRWAKPVSSKTTPSRTSRD